MMSRLLVVQLLISSPLVVIVGAAAADVLKQPTTTKTTTTTTTTTLSQSKQPVQSPPNIILMLIDDMGWYNAPWNGNSEIIERMPFLYELATNHGIILDRQYSYKYCSPSRSSLLSGRLPIHVTQNNKNNDVTNPGGVDLRMELLPQVLKKEANANYVTSCIGKWHIGARSHFNLPTERGFDHHFGFLKGGEDHWNQTSYDGSSRDELLFTDLYENHSPAFDRNGTYSTYLYTTEAIKVIKNHAAARITTTTVGTAETTAATTNEQDNNNKRPTTKNQSPLFMYLAWQVMHTPLEVPPEFVHDVPNDTNAKARAKMNGMGAILDEGIRNVTTALHETGLWDNTIVVVTSDNGGWIQLNRGGNNHPLRGGKVTDFEGGVRTAAFVTGGYVQRVAPHLIGTRSQLLVHIVDWYATLVGLAAASEDGSKEVVLNNEVRPNHDDSKEERKHDDDDDDIPPIDSKDFWKALIDPQRTNNVTTVRKEIPLSYCNEVAECDFPGGIGDSALISWPWKIVNGTQGGLGVWQGKQFPNSTMAPPIPQPGPDHGCPMGCLFNIKEDPTEHFNIKDDHPDVYERLRKRLIEIGQGVYQTKYDGGAKDCIPVDVAYKRDKGFLAPRCSSAVDDDDEGDAESIDHVDSEVKSK